MKKTVSFSLLFLLIPFLASHNLENAISSDDRDPKNKMRDSARNPYETLSFFEIEQDMTVVELSPGSGWYTEILAKISVYQPLPGESSTTVISCSISKKESVS